MHTNNISSHSDLLQEASMTGIVNLNQSCQILSYKIQETSFSKKKHGYEQKIWRVQTAVGKRRYAHSTSWGFLLTDNEQTCHKNYLSSHIWI